MSESFNLRRFPRLRRAWHSIRRTCRRIFWAPWIFANVLRRRFRHDVVLYDGYAPYLGWKLLPANWGDDLNLFFFSAITGMKMVPVPPSAWSFPVRRHVLIGSILNWSDLDGAEVYGSGIIDPGKPVHGVPRRIRGVRGPLTRDILLARGIDCPPAYGDPALLLPLFYSPRRNPDGPVTIVPHADTGDCPSVQALLARGCHRVDMRTPARWQDIPDQIAGASLVLSESLHGLIVAEAYRVPCVWVEFTPHGNVATTGDWGFKFRDFYASIGKTVTAPLQLFAADALRDFGALRAAWTPGRFDFRDLADRFPFPFAVPPRFP